jgi:hypothetical protein
MQRQSFRRYGPASIEARSSFASGALEGLTSKDSVSSTRAVTSRKLRSPRCNQTTRARNTRHFDRPVATKATGGSGRSARSRSRTKLPAVVADLDFPASAHRGSRAARRESGQPSGRQCCVRVSRRRHPGDRRFAPFGQRSMPASSRVRCPPGADLALCTRGCPGRGRRGGRGRRRGARPRLKWRGPCARARAWHSRGSWAVRLLSSATFDDLGSRAVVLGRWAPYDDD